MKKEISKKDESALRREEALEEAFENASPEVLMAILLDPVYIVRRVGLKLQMKLSEVFSKENLNPRELAEREELVAEIRSWIPLFSSISPAVVEMQTKEFYEILKESKYDFFAGDLESLALAYKGKSNLGDTALELLQVFLKHEDTTEEQVLNVINQFSNNRKGVFKEVCQSKFKLSFTGLVRCLVYLHVGKEAMAEIESMEDINSPEFDRTIVKGFLMEAISNIHVREKVFKMLSRLEMFTEEDLLVLDTKVGISRFVAQARSEMK